MPKNCLNVFDHFVGLALKRLNHAHFDFFQQIFRYLQKHVCCMLVTYVCFMVQHISDCFTLGQYIVLFLKILDFRLSCPYLDCHYLSLTLITIQIPHYSIRLFVISSNAASVNIISGNVVLLNSVDEEAVQFHTESLSQNT